MSKFSVKKPLTIFVAVVFIIIMGIVSFWKMTTDLLPEFSLPYVIVVTTYVGASPDKVGSTVTEPLEASLGTVNGVVDVVSHSYENYSMLMLEFEEGTDMDSAMVKLSTALDLLTLPDGVGKPMILELSMDMLPVNYVSVDYEGMDIYELSDFVNDTVVPAFERLDGVASVDTVGLIEKTVEIRLNKDKINDLNTDLGVYVSDELDKAKDEIDKARSELNSAEGQLSSAAKELQEQQTNTANELAQTSQLVNQAMATQAAYNAQLTGLQASQTALETEMKAYEDAGLTGMQDQFVAAIVELQEILRQSGESGTEYPKDLEDAIQNPAKLNNLITLLTKIANGEATDVPGLENAENLNKLINTITGFGQGGEGGEVDQEMVRQVLNIMMVRIPQIDTELANLNVEIMAAEAASNMVNEQVKEAVDNYAALEAGKITAAAGFGSGAAQIAAGQSAIADGKAKLDEAVTSFENARDTALKNANLDALLNLQALSGIIYAQNFAMPAGYIYEGEDQYLLKVGDEFASKEELENALLVNIDGLGDIHLCDVADVTWIDNKGDAYAKVNGNEAVVVTIQKASTAGTSAVSDNVERGIAQLEEKYEGLSITSIMDQGMYIDLIVKNVLQNLVYGAILAIIVLALFLKSVKPTVVVAVSIPMSVLTAIVCMYFSGITLNIMSLSGLALGIGMLVDNSIVVIENIYRLRGKGIPAAKAAVLGARQVSGAIVASTLTTICVFLPIVFTSGLVKQLFVDMALTITFSLVASLVMALTIVPAMSATTLKNDKPKTLKALDKLLGVYEKVLRFSLKRKAVPILLSIVLLVLCGLQAMRTGLILLPNMGGDQMSVSFTLPEEMTDEEAFAEADKAMDQFCAIEGVDYIGIISGRNSANVSAASLTTSSGGTHNMNVFILVDEKTAKDNSKVYEQLQEICAGLNFEDYSVSRSNMDFSSYMDTGLGIKIYGPNSDKLLEYSEAVMDIVSSQEGFIDVTNGQEEGADTIELTVKKDVAMADGLTVAQILQELAGNLTTDANATILTIDDNQYNVKLIDETKRISADELMDYEFEVNAKDDDGNDITEVHTLSEYAEMTYGKSLAGIHRENQRNYITVSAVADEGYNTTLLTREIEPKLNEYEETLPEGYTIEIGGEMTAINDALVDLVLMITLAIIFIYLIMVAQFQSFISPFIVIFTVPLAFTGGFIAVFISGADISMVSMMGFLMLTGVIVNNGIVFVDYTNQLRIAGMEKQEALVETGKSRMRPILMTAMTTILAMSTMIFSKDAAAEMSRGMAVVVIGGLIYATLMTLIIIPVLYDLMYRKQPKVVDLSDLDSIDIEEDFITQIAEAAGEEIPVEEVPSEETPAEENNQEN